MKGKWENMETAPRDGRPVWCRGQPNTGAPEWDYRSFWSSCDSPRDPWLDAATGGVSEPDEWFNPEAAP